MAKYQYPIDGQMGKTWKITSKMGWRIHPVKKTKKHHNGTDICGLGKAPWYIEAIADGKVLKAQVSTAAGGGFGHYVIVQHKIDGEYYTSLYAHMEPGSMQVKSGQKITAGTVLGKMGTSGMSTGIHLHLEIWKGKTHGWSDNGVGFVEPIGFIKALMASEKAKGFASVAASDDDPVEPAPVHTPVKKATAKPVAKPVDKPKTPAKPAAKSGSWTVKSGDTLTAIAKATNHTVEYLQKKNGIKNANDIKVGQVIKY